MRRRTRKNGPGYNVPAERNPPLVAFANPRRRVVAKLSRRVYAIQYRHVEDGKNYTHDFKTGVCMELLADGSVRIYHMGGKPLFGDF